MCYLKPEIIVKFFNVVFHLLIKGTGAIPINLRQIGIEHDLNPADGVYPRSIIPPFLVLGVICKFYCTGIICWVRPPKKSTSNKKTI